MIENVPNLGYTLLSHIPRLESVAMNILYQNKNFDGTGFPKNEVSGESIPKGGRTLKILGDYIRMLERKIPMESVFASMYRMTELYDPKLVEQIAACFGVLNLTKGKAGSHQIVKVEISKLQEGDILIADILTNNGVLFINAGTVLTPILLMKLHNFAELMDVTTPIRVRRALSEE